MRLHQLDEHASQLNDAPEVSVTEAGGYYTQPVYDMIEKHGYEKVMRELLASLHADVIQDFLSRADLDESLNEVSTSGDYANVYYDYKEDFYMIEVFKDGKKVAEDNDYFGAMAQGNPLKDKFLELVNKAGLEPEGLRLVSTGGDEPDETGVFKNGKFNWHKSSSVSESPFKGIGKMAMKRKLNKQYKKSDLANFDDSGIDTSGKTPDEIRQMKSDYYHDHMDKAARAKKAGDRLSGKNKVKESTEMMTEAQFDEAAGEKDACYRKVKARYKVWPSAYASGALTKCRKVGAANWGNSKKK